MTDHDSPAVALLGAQLNLAIDALSAVMPIVDAALAMADLVGTDTDPADATDAVITAATNYRALLHARPRLHLYEWGPVLGPPLHPSWAIHHRRHHRQRHPPPPTGP